MDPNTQTLSQACGQNWTCDAYVQAPECNASSPAVSPYDSFRIYSYYELARETGSTLDINASFVDPSVLDMILVNGQYQPVMQDLSMSTPILLRVVAAMSGGIVMLKFPSASAAVCSWTMVAYDGVYLQEGVSGAAGGYFKLVEGGRGDVQVVCHSAGVHDLVTYGGRVILQLNVSSSGSGSGSSSSRRRTSAGTTSETTTVTERETERETETATQTTAGVLDSELASIVRPSYLQDLRTPNTVVNAPYSLAFWQDGFNQSICGTKCTAIYMLFFSSCGLSTCDLGFAGAIQK